MQVRDFLEQSADSRPYKTALVCGRSTLDYRAVEFQANQLANALVQNGIQPGDRIGIHLPNSAEAVVSIFAALKAGAVFVPINPATRPDKLQYILEDCAASALISHAPAPNAHSLTHSLKLLVHCGEQAPGVDPVINPRSSAGPGTCRRHSLRAILEVASGERPRRVGCDDDLACLIYTSGSTGKPKGVMCGNRNVVFASGSIIQYLENSESDVILNALPLSFDYGLYQLLMTFRFGGTLVLESSAAFPSLLLQRIAECRVTGLPGVPSLFTLLLAQDFHQHDLTSLRYVTNTGAALPSSQALELQSRLPHAKLFCMYGLTETKRALYLPPNRLSFFPGSVGIPIPGTEAWIVDADGRRLEPGHSGELVVCGPHVMQGYWGDELATARRFRTLPDGRRICFTGDLFRQDASGHFYFVSRQDDILKIRGEKVAPAEVENVLCQMPQILEAAVIGLPDPVFGHLLRAYVVSRAEPPALNAVLAHCRARLEEFMIPREIQFCPALPRNGSGKIDKLALVSDGVGSS